MTHVLGLDAGNTKTVALLARLDGVIVGAGRAGCGDIYGAGSPEAALVQIDAALAGALKQAGDGLDLTRLAAACGSMAGADWPEDIELIRCELAARGPTRNPSVYNDALGTLRAGTPARIGTAPPWASMRWWPRAKWAWSTPASPWCWPAACCAIRRRC